MIQGYKVVVQKYSARLSEGGSGGGGSIVLHNTRQDRTTITTGKRKGLATQVEKENVWEKVDSGNISL